MAQEPPVVFLRGKRVYLRPIEKTDASRMLRWINDPETRRWLGRCHPLNLTREEEYIDNKYKDDRDVTLAIVLTEGDRHIGSVGLHHIDLLNQTAVTGMLIGEKDSRGQGYGPAAKALMLDYAFNTLNLRTVRSATIATNVASARSLEKSGYVQVGRLPDQFFREGCWHDELLWCITRKQWKVRQS